MMITPGISANVQVHVSVYMHCVYSVHSGQVFKIMTNLNAV